MKGATSVHLGIKGLIEYSTQNAYVLRGFVMSVLNYILEQKWGDTMEKFPPELSDLEDEWDNLIDVEGKKLWFNVERKYYGLM